MGGLYSTLLITARAPGVAQLTMARPAVFNAFDETMIGELDAAFGHLIADPAVRVIVLAGEGKHFSAGADLQWMQRASTASQDWNLQDARRFAGMLARIAGAPKPVAVAAENASFAVSEAKFGILPAVIGPHVTNAVGKRQAQRLALTTERIHAAEALAMGLVQKVVGLTELDAAVDATVTALLAGGPAAQAEIKQLFAQLEVGPITPAVIELTAQTISRVRGSAEAREGFAAFLGKRPPNWMPQPG
jgi:methylglutaconyl-CoA hydratase